MTRLHTPHILPQPPPGNPDGWRRKWHVSPHMQGCLLLLLAVALFWAAQRFDPNPQQAHHRLLVSTAKVRGDVFEKSVVLVLHHMKSGATGIVLNKEKPGAAGGNNIGGPVGPEKVITLHTLDATIPETAVMKDIRMGVVKGEAATQKLLARKPPPSTHIRVEGYAGWRGRQLDYEIDRGEWHIIPFDKSLIALKGEEMWAAADAAVEKAAAARAAPEK